MAQFGDIIARLFSGGGTRGLSGDSERVLPPGPEHGVYNDFLRRHRTEQDLVADPAWLWSTSSSVLRRKGGLVAHLLDQKTDSIADFTDILVILSQADNRRVRREREGWRERASAVLSARFQEFCDEEDYHLLFPRPAAFRFLEDGCPEMDGMTLGLRPGEFVTGLLPNLYLGPGEVSKPTLNVLLNLPGQWQGYQEVGKLYSDQSQFTLGTHWLDSYRHPGLQRPLLYRLQQSSDGRLVHVIHPDLQDSYRVKAHTAPDGVSVLTLVDKNNRSIAHVILSVVEEGETDPAADMPPPAFGPGIQLPPGPGPAASGPSSLAGSPHRTVVPLDLDERIFRLRERGALLQRVHFGKFMDGYDVYLGAEGSVQTSMAEPAATFQVRGKQVSLVAHRVGLVLDGQPLPVGTAIPLRGDVRIGLGAQTVEYRDLSGVAADGWPYLGEIRRLAGSASLVFGGVYRIGRDKTAKIRLPDEPENDNIQWLPGVIEGAMIRSRTGDIPKSRFYTDSIMVASLHAEVDLRGGEPELISLARHCYTFVRRGKEIIGLNPVDKAGGPLRARLRSGDEILVGNCVFEVSYPPPDVFGAEALADRSLSGTAPPPLSADELPPAAGLGELGPAPPRPALRHEHEPDSFDEGAMAGKGAQLALAGAGPSMFGEAPSERKGGPRLVIDEDFGAAFRRPDNAAAPRPSLADLAALPAAHPPSPPTPAPLTLPPAPLLPPPEAWVVREDHWQLELSRPGRLVLEGWMVTGDATITNYHRAAVALPENQSRPEQRFSPVEYFQIYVRGGRAEIRTLGAPDANLSLDGAPVTTTDRGGEARMVVVRRDDRGAPDFEIRLTLRPDTSLPDPRAQLLRVDLGERVVRAMFTLGLPRRDLREIALGPIRAQALFDGESVSLSDYLDSYRLPGGGFHPFFVRHGNGAWRTAPEDGEDLVLEPGDHLMAGAAVYVFERD